MDRTKFPHGYRTLIFTGSDWEETYCQPRWLMGFPPYCGYKKYDDEGEVYGAIRIRILQDLFFIGTAGYSDQIKL